jgi:hypothetical protein
MGKRTDERGNTINVERKVYWKMIADEWQQIVFDSEEQTDDSINDFFSPFEEESSDADVPF